jgi:integrase
MADSKLKGSKKATSKPRFPLSQYKRGKFTYWVKKINQKRVYFERIDNDPRGEVSLQQWQDLLAGRTPESGGAKSGLTLRKLCNLFMEFQESRKARGKIGQRTFDEYQTSCKILLDCIGKQRQVETLRPEQFASIDDHLAERFGVNRIHKHITQIRSVFEFAFSEGLIEKSISFGKRLEKPNAKELRTHRAQKGRMDFTKEEILKLIKHSNATQKAMVLLGVNGGLGNSDIADLRKENLDLENGWIDYPRAKTGTERFIPLWKETVTAIKAAIRPNESPYVFTSIHGTDYTDPHRTGWRVTGEFRQVLSRSEIETRNRGFYALRRTFATQAQACCDREAVDSIMGHTIPESDMGARYRQELFKNRLLKAVSVVHDWLFSEVTK